MRLHRLTVTAFGPFAGTEEVDFDELNASGLFLLTGPTGAGKSSLLDAVCFALYGTVPGVRGVKALKSQHSPAETKPEVVLDFSVQGRRFVVRRTPEWTRPKKRGSGVLAEKASASIMETTTGAEHLLSARAAEVGLLVNDLMGMTAAQFVQVALLPQGEFQTFLRASSQDRHAVLQHLFRTDRFARIEEWVGDHSRRLKDEAGAGQAGVQRILDTVAERAGTPMPEDLAGEGLATAAADGRVSGWVGEVLTNAEQQARLAAEPHEAARRTLDEARSRHRDAEARSERRRRATTAWATLTALESSAAEAEDARARLTAHDRAVRCRPVLDLQTRAADALERAEAARDAAVHRLTEAPVPSVPGLQVPAPVTTGALSALVQTARDHAAHLEALLPREQEALAARRELERDRELCAAAEQDQRGAVSRAAELPTLMEHHTAALTAAAASAAQRDGLVDALTAARERHAAAVELVEVGDRLATQQDRRRDARDRAQDARDRLQDLVARRLAGMAAELAGALVDGVACQVCGSLDHPGVAVAAEDPVTDRDHELADRALAEAAGVLDEEERRLRDLQGRHDRLAALAGGLTCVQAAERIVELEGRLAEAERAHEEHDVLRDDLRRLRDEQSELAERESAAASSVARLRESIATHQRTVAAVSAELAQSLGGVASLAGTVTSLGAWCGLVLAAEEASAARDDARQRLESLTVDALATSTEQGFTTLDAVRDALLDEDDRHRLDGSLQARADEEARARAVLDDPDLADVDTTDEAHDEPPELLAALASAVVEAETAADQAGRELALREDEVRSLRLQEDRLAGALQSWAPVRDRSLRAEGISRLVRGTGHDNQLQMRLSAYVLATRLDQVVAAANERLGHMRDQRYLLQRTGRAERRGSQAGLGLEVVDQWTGDVRAPATLSGGETFVVSLSLALGLADVVTHEAGGTEVETLFVDEGFGSLDADTLDDVMDRLDGLRAGGRIVGVVSHVAEMRTRIPTQVHVAKGRSGSTVSVRTLVG